MGLPLDWFAKALVARLAPGYSDVSRTPHPVILLGQVIDLEQAGLLAQLVLPWTQSHELMLCGGVFAQLLPQELKYSSFMPTCM
jgi:hypothetical protein